MKIEDFAAGRMAQNVTEVFRAKVPSVGLVLKARADIGGERSWQYGNKTKRNDLK